MVRAIAGAYLAAYGACVTLRGVGLAILPRILIPLLALMVLEIVDIGLNDDLGLLGHFLFAASILLYSSVAVITHRVVILGKDSVPSIATIEISRREWRFAGTFILVGVVATVPLVIVQFALQQVFDVPTVLFFVILFTLGGYILSRLALIFPTIAIDAPVSVSRVLETSKQYQGPLFMVCVVAPLAFTVSLSTAAGLVAKATVVDVRPLIEVIISVPLLVFEIAMLSQIFILAQRDRSAS